MDDLGCGLMDWFYNDHLYKEYARDIANEIIEGYKQIEYLLLE